MAHLPDSTLRSCDYPGCSAIYDAVTGPPGQTPDRCWRRHRSFFLELCPDHSPLWGGGDGPHVPRLNRETSAASCSCGEGLPGVTLGQMKEAYQGHLRSVFEADSSGGSA